MLLKEGVLVKTTKQIIGTTQQSQAIPIKSTYITANTTAQTSHTQ
jgi:hypothetical protein